MNYIYTFWFAMAGLFWGGIPGALVGGTVGFVLDNMRLHHRHRARASVNGFIVPLFALLGSVAKADGRVSEAEIAVAERMMARMGLSIPQRQQAAASFNRGKQPDFDIDSAIHGLRQWVSDRNHAFAVLEVVMDTVLAESHSSDAKMTILRQVALALRVSEMELMALLAMKGHAWHGGAYGRGPDGARDGYTPPVRHRGPDPYRVLGIGRDADERAVKRAYRKLISRYHPDRLGDLPEAMRKRAGERASEINAAYEQIKMERGFG